MAVGDRQPSLRSRSVNEHSLALAREWKKLGRLATAIALLTSPILYAAIATTLEWRWYWCALASLAAVGVVSRRPGELPPFPAMFFRPGDLRGELGVPLEATPPAALTRANLFTVRFQQGQDASVFPVLDR